MTEHTFLTYDQYLELQADDLLKQSCSLGSKHGVYTERQLRRHCKREIVDTELASLSISNANAELTELAIADLRHLGKLAKLTDLQQDAWNLRVLGMSIRKIAAACGVSTHAIQSRLELARFKVIRAMVAYPYFGLWEVYYQLIRRGCK